MKSHGLRSGTRKLFSQPFRKHGPVKTSKYLQVYKVGDMVDIKVNPAVHKGMPHKFYHGKTGRVYAILKRALIVVVHKRVKHRMVEKMIQVRVEHVTKSRCNEDHIARVKATQEKRNNAKEGEKVERVKRVIEGPRPEYVISLDKCAPIQVSYEPYHKIF
ncbi:60S ribosomal protein L21 [Astathelohania contejeani]|uniref:60S ribosomal protein L21 n=1 Tax=Astathelohania contejeani TaxID=164912 RepID=A0ABQ7HVW7_9MICR|nr:60S ribosomal protein L21 [Thelohania contejeani]